MINKSLKENVIRLRKTGKTYGEIRRLLNNKIPKGTLSYWCNNIKLTSKQKKRISKIILSNVEKSRGKALLANKIKREQYLKSVYNRNQHLAMALKNKDITKIVLSTLYLGEGSKAQRGSLMFGNSDPFIISLFLYTLRYSYDIDETKFRCTLQCRADQNIKKLEEFWTNITKIPPSQFYKARIDPRTIGKPSKKRDYKGVCRIDYFSAEIFTELKQIANIIYNGPMA
jgi:hypothetical protein